MQMKAAECCQVIEDLQNCEIVALACVDTSPEESTFLLNVYVSEITQ